MHDEYYDEYHDEYDYCDRATVTKIATNTQNRGLGRQQSLMSISATSEGSSLSLQSSAGS